MAQYQANNVFQETNFGSDNISSRFAGYFSSAPGILSVLLLALGIPLNSLYIFQSRKSTKGSVTMAFIKVTLAVSNIIVAMCLILCFTWIAILPPADVNFGNNLLPYVFASLWQSLLLLGVAVDRYIAVIKPLHYHSLVTKTRVIVFATGTCLLGIAFACIVLVVPGITAAGVLTLNENATLTLDSLYTPEYSVFFTTWLVLLMLVAVVMWSMYIPILITIRKQHRAVQQQMSNHEQSTGIATSHRGTIMLCAAMIYFTISYIPMLVFLQVPGLRFVLLGSQEMMSRILIVNLSACSGCILNPFLYGLCSSDCLRPKY